MDIPQTIKYVLNNCYVGPQNRKNFQNRLLQGPPFTKGDGSPDHVNVFFLPFDTSNNKIYLGHHKKANDWIPPGGHIDPGETPVGAAIREMHEELKQIITKDQLTPFNLSKKLINRLDKGCLTHFDIWFWVDTPEKNFDFLKKEYFDAGWFSVKEGVSKIKKNPDFANIISDYFIEKIYK